MSRPEDTQAPFTISRMIEVSAHDGDNDLQAVASFSMADVKVSDHLLSVTNDSVTGASRANLQSSEK